jgi:hypothetical protein
MKRHAGSGLPQGHLNRGTERKPSPTHGGSGRPKGRVHDAPSPGGAVNRGGSFGMGVLAGKKRK